MKLNELHTPAQSYQLDNAFAEFAPSKRVTLKKEARKRIEDGEKPNDVIHDILVKNGVSPTAIKRPKTGGKGR